MKITARGKIKRMSAFGGHLMSGKSGKRRRSLRRPRLISPTISRKVKACLGK